MSIHFINIYIQLKTLICGGLSWLCFWSPELTKTDTSRIFSQSPPVLATKTWNKSLPSSAICCQVRVGCWLETTPPASSHSSVWLQFLKAANLPGTATQYIAIYSNMWSKLHLSGQTAAKCKHFFVKTCPWCWRDWGIVLIYSLSSQESNKLDQRHRCVSLRGFSSGWLFSPPRAAKGNNK